jgi:hypothetical protein
MALSYCVLRHRGRRGKYVCRHRTMQFPGDGNRLLPGVLHIIHLAKARVRHGQPGLILCDVSRVKIRILEPCAAPVPIRLPVGLPGDPALCDLQWKTSGLMA